MPPNTPIIALLLQDAAKKAELVRRKADQLASARELEHALAILDARGFELPDEALGAPIRMPSQRELEQAALVTAKSVERATGEQVERLHPAVQLLRSPGGWSVVGNLSDQVALVSDGNRVGATGIDDSWQCVFCDSHGPWSGTRCLSCGNMSDTDWVLDIEE
ncbi:hypothetical protein ACU61A_12495 [Pseudonocardia sichuanensis]